MSISIDDLLKGPQRTVNLDALSMSSREDVSRATFKALSATQSYEPHIQVLASACLFAALSMRLGLSAEEMFHKADRILRDKDFDRNSNFRFQALRDYAGAELKDKVD